MSFWMFLVWIHVCLTFNTVYNFDYKCSAQSCLCLISLLAHTLYFNFKKTVFFLTYQQKSESSWGDRETTIMLWWFKMLYQCIHSDIQLIILALTYFALIFICIHGLLWYTKEHCFRELAPSHTLFSCRGRWRDWIFWQPSLGKAFLFLSHPRCLATNGLRNRDGS